MAVSQSHEDRLWDEFSPDSEEFNLNISAPKNVADLRFAYRKADEHIPPTPNNWTQPEELVSRNLHGRRDLEAD
jgi:hypothetical protein